MEAAGGHIDAHIQVAHVSGGTGPARCVHLIGDLQEVEDDVRAALNGGHPLRRPSREEGWRGPGDRGSCGDAASAVKRAVVAHPVSLSQFAEAHTHQLQASELRDQRVDAGA